jgi:hypothetical protein
MIHPHSFRSTSFTLVRPRPAYSFLPSVLHNANQNPADPITPRPFRPAFNKTSIPAKEVTGPVVANQTVRES